MVAKARYPACPEDHLRHPQGRWTSVGSEETIKPSETSRVSYFPVPIEVLVLCAHCVDFVGVSTLVRICSSLMLSTITLSTNT